MDKRKNKINNFLIVIISILTIIQLSFYLHKTISKNKENEKIVTDNINTNTTTINFTQINNEFKEIENLDIININNNSGEWKIEIFLSGDNTKIINSLNKLKNMEKYTINNYNIIAKEGFFTLKLDLYRKK